MFYHRDGDYPAMILSNYVSYMKDGKFHRSEGASRIWASGYREYNLNGKFYPQIETDDEWFRYQKLLAFE